MFRTNSKRRPNKSMRKSRKHRKGGDDVSGGLKRRKSRKGGGNMPAYDKQEYISKSLPLNISYYADAIRYKEDNEISLNDFKIIKKNFMAKFNKAINDYDNAIKNGTPLEIQPEIPPEDILRTKDPFLDQLESRMSEPKPWWKIF